MRGRNEDCLHFVTMSRPALLCTLTASIGYLGLPHNFSWRSTGIAVAYIVYLSHPVLHITHLLVEQIIVGMTEFSIVFKFSRFYNISHFQIP